MKISFIIHELAYSGAPRIMSWVCNSFAEQGHDCQLICIYGNESFLKIYDSVNTKMLGFKQSRSLKRYFNELFRVNNRIKKELDAFNPDAVITFLDTASYFFIYLNHFFYKHKFKVVASERVDPYEYKGLRKKIRVDALKYVDANVFQTYGAKDYFNNYDIAYSVVIPNPVIGKRNSNVSVGLMRINYKDREKTIVSVGRLRNCQKRFDVMFKAFEIVHQKYPEYRFIIYGDGPSESLLRNLSEELGLKDALEFAGRIDNVEQTIYNASVFAFSSDFEGIPNSLIEALSCGVPCVATDCSPGGAKLLIRDGENGFIVPKGDFRSLADKICLLIEDSDLSNKFSRTAIKIVDEFSPERIFAMWKELIGGLME